MALAGQEFHLPAQYNPCGGERESMAMNKTRLRKRQRQIQRQRQRQRQRQGHIPAQYIEHSIWWEGGNHDDGEQCGRKREESFLSREDARRDDQGDPTTHIPYTLVMEVIYKVIDICFNWDVE